MGTNPKTLSTLETTIAIINALRELNGGRITELADYLDLPKSTVHRHLQTLYEHGFVSKFGDEYRLGLLFLDFGAYTRHSVNGYRTIRPIVDELAEITGERCQFVVEEHGRGVYVYVASANADVDRSDLRIGKRMFLHSTASGKSILAHLPDSRIDEVIERWGLPSQTQHTVTTKEALQESLAVVREKGYSFNRGGNVDGLRAVGAPVTGSSGMLLGAISISGPAYRMQGEWFDQEIPELLLEAIDAVEGEL